MTQSSRAQIDPRPESAIERVLSLVSLVSIIAVAVVVTPSASDVFRFPKELWVRGEAVAIIACWIILAIYGVRPDLSRRDRPVVLLTVAAVAWTWMTALLSMNRALSVRAAFWASAIAVILLTMFLLARDRWRISDLWFLILPGCINALVVVSQAYSIWNPFTFAPSTTLDQRITAFIGNPNELGSYLVLPLLVSLSLLIAVPRQRWLFAILSLICIEGLIASRTRTALIAAAAGVFCMFWIATKKRAWVAAAIALTLVCIAIILPLGGFVTRDDLQKLRTIEGLNIALTSRVTPSLAALSMFEDHPLFGVGPGAYSYWYFDYKIAVEREYPTLFHTGVGFQNFGEAHNDHAQILAETGLPGYLLFLAILTFVGWHSFRAGPDSELTHAARLLAFPVSAALFVVCFAQFPLRVASTTVSYGFVLTTALGWLRR